MAKRELLKAVERIKFQLFAGKEEQELIKHNSLTPENFFLLFNVLNQLDCFFMQLELISKYYPVIANDLLELENNSQPVKDKDIFDLLERKCQQAITL